MADPNAIYRQDRDVPADYPWSEEGRRLAGHARTLDICWRVLTAFLIVAAAAFCYARSSAFSGIGTVLALVGAAVVLGWGIMLSGAGVIRRRLWKLPARARDDYALRLYHARYGAAPKKASELLLGMARADIEDSKLGEAAVPLAAIDPALLDQDELKLFYLLSYIETFAEGGKSADEALVRYLAVPGKRFEGFPDEDEARSWLEKADAREAAEAVSRIHAPKGMHPAATLALFLMAAHCLAFFGMLYGVNTDMGWMLRCGYASTAGALASLSVLILGIALTRLIAKGSWQAAGEKKSALPVRVVLVICTIVAALALSLQCFIYGPWVHDGTERCIAEDVEDNLTGRTYDYLALTWPGYQPDEATTNYWRTQDPFLMERWSEALAYDPEAQELVASGDGGSQDAQSADADSGSSATSSTEGSDTAKTDTGLVDTEARMSTLASYLVQNGVIPKTGVFEMDADAKGNAYASLGTGTDIEGSKAVTVEYCILSNGETMDEDGNPAEEFVLEKWYSQDDGREPEIVGFYLVDESTLAVTDEVRTSW